MSVRVAGQIQEFWPVLDRCSPMRLNVILAQFWSFSAHIMGRFPGGKRSAAADLYSTKVPDKGTFVL
jgi:hypothetical protein